MMRKIGVISDTHIPHFKKIPEAVWEHFAGVELIIHAGDLSILQVIHELETIAPVVAVQGNIETEEVVLALPIKREILVGGCRIGIVHILGETNTRVRLARHEYPNARCVVYGHSHIPTIKNTMGNYCLIQAARMIAVANQDVALVYCILMTNRGVFGGRLLKSNPQKVHLFELLLCRKHRSIILAKRR